MTRINCVPVEQLSREHLVADQVLTSKSLGPVSEND